MQQFEVRCPEGTVKFVLGSRDIRRWSIQPAVAHNWVNPNLGPRQTTGCRGTGHPGKLVARLEPRLKEHSTGIKAAPAKLGNRTYQPIEPAPGRYVKTGSA